MIKDRFIPVMVLVTPNSQVGLGIAPQEIVRMNINSFCIESYSESFSHEDDTIPVYTQVTMKSGDQFIVPMKFFEFEELLEQHDR